MTWDIFYLACFAVGLALCAASVFTGGHFHHGHVHFGGHSHLHAPGARLHGGPAHSSGGISPFNGFTLTAFLCWFGGTGYLLRSHAPLVAPVILLLATLSGLAGAALIFWFLASVLLPRERALTAEETDVMGVVGRVTGPLYPGATGEILYTQLGARRSAPARSEIPGVIERGSEVVVLRYEHGVAWVRPLHDLDL
jgi:hypothetical protein